MHNLWNAKLDVALVQNYVLQKLGLCVFVKLDTQNYVLHVTSFTKTQFGMQRQALRCASASIFDMAQKRNPVSLRLQTRLQGYEKHFASCWFTDSFFSQVYANDLVKRLYLGHLLQKGGGWYGEISDSRVPETCISIQFLYRKCSVLCVVLDKRKEEYLLSTSTSTKQSFVKPRREDVTLLSQAERKSSRLKGTRQAQADDKPLAVNGKDACSLLQSNTREKSLLRNRDDLFHLCGGIYTSLFSQRLFAQNAQENVLADKIVYQSIANSFGSLVAKHRHPILFDKWKDLLHKRASYNYDVAPHSPYLSAIESICDLARSGNGIDKGSTRAKHSLARLCQAKLDIGLCESYPEQPFSVGANGVSDYLFDAVAGTNADLEKEIAKHSFASGLPLKLSPYWTSLSLIRGVSACQSVEFCLYSVLFLCKKRFSFLKIKELVFKMLASNSAVRGARLVCSGRQGGRSKSAMRAKKQSALWGETALSLFSSRLAFASTNVDTSFGQIGIKLWICYKSEPT